jgi:hypothetical protein
MRIETFNANATSSENNSVFEMWTTDDALSHLQGFAEIEVIDDRRKLIPPPEGWTEQLYARRVIRGSVTSKLNMWDERSSEFGRETFLGGIRLPEERSSYRMQEVMVDYDQSTNILTIQALEPHSG